MKRSRLARGKGLRATKAMRRGGRMRQKGRRAEREAPALQAAIEAVRARCGGRCERCSARARIDVHHMKRNPRVHEPEVMAGLCRTCHDGIHAHTVLDWRRWLLT